MLHYKKTTSSKKLKISGTVNKTKTHNPNTQLQKKRRPQTETNIVPKKHLDYGNPSPVKLPSKRFLEGITIVDTKPGLSAAGKAAMILVEGHGEQGLLLLRRH